MAKTPDIRDEPPFRIRYHKTYGHGLRPGTDRDINCGSCIQEDATRTAHVGIADPSQGPVVSAYLPSNYKVTEVHDTYAVIEGVDNAGWTLDDYVIPRLASGLIFAKEV
jgi:hypothetical protein